MAHTWYSAQKTVAFILLISVAGCAISHIPPVPHTDQCDAVLHTHTTDDASIILNSVYLGEFVPSFYQIIDEADETFQNRTEQRAIFDRNAHVLAHVDAEFYRRLMIEGCGRLRDERVVTYDTRIDNEIRFKVTKASFGEGYGNAPLCPYRSVAVDPTVIELGALLYVPAVVGVQLSDGSFHDGLFIAEDTGSAIKGNRIDFFVGFADHIRNEFSVSRALTHGVPTAVYQIHR